MLENKYIYRLWRLRRLVAFNVALPAAALGILWLVSGGTASFAQPASAVAILIVALADVLIFGLRFPRATAQTAQSGVFWVCIIFLSPIADLLLAQIDGPVQGKHRFGLVLLFLLAWGVLSAAIAHLTNWLVTSAPRTTFTWSAILDTKVSAPEIFDALRARPNRTDPFRTTGSADENGRFPVWLNHDFVGEQRSAGTSPSESGPPLFHTTVTETGPLSCTMVSELPTGEAAVEHLMVEAMHNGSRITFTETSSMLTLTTVILFRLDDFGTDYVQSQIDLAEGRTDRRTNRLQTFDTPAHWFARLFRWTENPAP